MSYAIITGASKGIGKSIAEILASKGINIILVARSENLLQKICSELEDKYRIEAKYIVVDFTLHGAAEKIYDWCKINHYEIKILINNAGYGLSGAFEKYTADEHTAMMAVNMSVPVSLCSLFLPQLKQQKKAYILNIASSASYQAVPGLAVYAATKSFVLSFSRALRKELRNSVVRVTCICPGSTDTNFVNQAQIGEKARKLADRVNMSPEMVAKIAVDAMLKGKAEVIPGFINKAGAVLTWLLPKSIMENGAMKIYEP